VAWPGSVENEHVSELELWYLWKSTSDDAGVHAGFWRFITPTTTFFFLFSDTERTSPFVFSFLASAATAFTLERLDSTVCVRCQLRHTNYNQFRRLYYKFMLATLAGAPLLGRRLPGLRVIAGVDLGEPAAERQTPGSPAEGRLTATLNECRRSYELSSGFRSWPAAWLRASMCQ
jgi:hypothetical protein